MPLSMHAMQPNAHRAQFIFPPIWTRMAPKIFEYESPIWKIKNGRKILVDRRADEIERAHFSYGIYTMLIEKMPSVWPMSPHAQQAIFQIIDEYGMHLCFVEPGSITAAVFHDNMGKLLRYVGQNPAIHAELINKWRVLERAVFEMTYTNQPSQTGAKL